MNGFEALVKARMVRHPDIANGRWLEFNGAAMLAGGQKSFLSPEELASDGWVSKAPSRMITAKDIEEACRLNYIEDTTIIDSIVSYIFNKEQTEDEGA